MMVKKLRTAAVEEKAAREMQLAKVVTIVYSKGKAAFSYRLGRCRFTHRGRKANKKMEASMREKACIGLSRRDAKTMLEHSDAFKDSVAGSCEALSSVPPSVGLGVL
jgi:hypothetical protein